MKFCISAIIFSFLLSACAVNQPSSIIDSTWIKKVDRLNHRILISEIDGVRIIDQHRIRRLEPGNHQLRVSSTKHGCCGRNRATDYTLEVKACTKYYLSAQHKKIYDNDDWEVKVREVPIENCRANS